MSDDDLKFVTDDDADDIDSAGTGHSAHLWFEFDHGWTDALQMNTLLSVGHASTRSAMPTAPTTSAAATCAATTISVFSI